MRPPKYPQEGLLTAVGCVGAVLMPFGSVLNFGGVSIVLPLLGFEVPGSVVLIVGTILMLGAIVADNRLSNRKTREQVILETLGVVEGHPGHARTGNERPHSAYPARAHLHRRRPFDQG